MLMLFQVLLCAKRAEVALSPTATFAIQNLASFSPKNAQISSLNPMEML